MPVEIQGIFDSIGSIFDNPFVQLFIQGIGVYFVVLWLAAAFWAYRDLQLRTSNPVLPYLAAAFIIVFTPVFFPLAVIVYRVVRPQERIGEVSERQLAEEALLAEVEAIKSCPTCGRRIHEDWVLCPSCRTRLNRVCPGCGRLVGLDWSLCAWCGRDFERHEPVQDRAPGAVLRPASIATRDIAAPVHQVAGARDPGMARDMAHDMAVPADAAPSPSVRAPSERGSTRGPTRSAGVRGGTPRSDRIGPTDPLPEP